MGDSGFLIVSEIFFIFIYMLFYFQPALVEIKTDTLNEKTYHKTIEEKTAT